jgi:hypothetical protein
VTKPSKRPSAEDRKAAFDELIGKLNAWTIPEKAVDRVHDAARASLNEVKALTEYEDGKVSRLLVVIAFLSAVVGAVFTRFASDYAWPGFDHFAVDSNWILPAATYSAFFAYALLVTWSVLKVLGAIRPTFNVPATWKGPGKPGLPTSMVFYQGILDVPAAKWGEAFEQLTAEDGTELKRYYAKCYVAETYLVAEKVADKLEVVSPGIDALRWAMGILLAFFLLFGATTVLIAPNRSISGQAPSGPTISPQSAPR